MIHEREYRYLQRAVVLAEEALDAGDEPFGSVLVSAQGEILAEDRNRIAGGDATQHPEFALARWAANHLTPEARAAATVYTSGEHCPMCAAAHGWLGGAGAHCLRQFDRTVMSVARRVGRGRTARGNAIDQRSSARAHGRRSGTWPGRAGSRFASPFARQVNESYQLGLKRTRVKRERRFAQGKAAFVKLNTSRVASA